MRRSIVVLGAVCATVAGGFVLAQANAAPPSKTPTLTVTRVTSYSTVSDLGIVSATLLCPEGTLPTGSGWDFDGLQGTVTTNEPDLANRQWVIHAVDLVPGQQVLMHVVCGAVSK